MGMLSCKQLWEGRGSRHGIRDAKTSSKEGLPILQLYFICTSVSFLSCAASSLFSSPLMTSCLLVSFLLRLDRASGGASSLQLGGSCSNSRKRGSISSSCGEGLVGEWPGPSGSETGPSKLRKEGKWRIFVCDWFRLVTTAQRNSSMTQVAIKWCD